MDQDSKLTQVLEWIQSRCAEPSTWGGAGVIAVLLHSIIKNAQLADSIVGVLAAVGGLLAIVLPHPPKQTTNINIPAGTSTVVLPPTTTTKTVDANTNNSTITIKGNK